MIISLYSPAPQCGKSTLANYLSREHGFLRLGFADTLKAMMEAFLTDCGYPKGHIDEMKKKPFDLFNGEKLRKGLQALGTEWGRGLNTNLWVEVMGKKLEIYKGRNIVIDDMRFKNEYDFLLSKGATLVMVLRSGVYNCETHASEGALDHEMFHFTHANYGSKKESCARFWEELN